MMLTPDTLSDAVRHRRRKGTTEEKKTCGSRKRVRWSNEQIIWWGEEKKQLDTQDAAAKTEAVVLC